MARQWEARPDLVENDDGSGEVMLDSGGTAGRRTTRGGESSGGWLAWRSWKPSCGGSALACTVRAGLCARGGSSAMAIGGAAVF